MLIGNIIIITAKVSYKVCLLIEVKVHALTVLSPVMMFPSASRRRGQLKMLERALLSFDDGTAPVTSLLLSKHCLNTNKSQN